MTSAFGKVILLGEHAVVHGARALAGAIDRRATCTARTGHGGATELSVPAWNLVARAGDDTAVGRAVATLCRELGADPPLALEVHTDLWPGAGLGSSAALSVACARAIAAARGRALAAVEVEAVAGEAERCFHGNPSGIDVALAARGGLGVFVRGRGLTALDAEPVGLVVGSSGEPRQTSAMVGRVADALAAEPASTRALLDQLGDAADTGIAAVERGELAPLGEAMNRAQAALARLGLSTARIDDMVAAALRAGAIAAKLTGAGGGGAVIALAPGREAEVESAWTALGCPVFSCRAGVKE